MLVPNLIVINYPKPTTGANALTVAMDEQVAAPIGFNMRQNRPK
jgi:hypothetical protein